MKILLAVDGSSHSDMLVRDVAGRPWPPGSEVKVLGCAHLQIPDVPDPILVYYSMRLELLEAERKRMHQVVNEAAEVLRKQGAAVKIEAEVLDGSPTEAILNVAEEWGADLIVVGSHGYGPVKKFLLGSVSQAVASHARCSVEIVRAISTDSENEATQR